MTVSDASVSGDFAGDFAGDLAGEARNGISEVGVGGCCTSRRFLCSVSVGWSGLSEESTPVSGVTSFGSDVNHRPVFVLPPCVAIVDYLFDSADSVATAVVPVGVAVSFVAGPAGADSPTVCVLAAVGAVCAWFLVGRLSAIVFWLRDKKAACSSKYLLSFSPNGAGVGCDGCASWEEELCAGCVSASPVERFSQRTGFGAWVWRGSISSCKCRG